MSAKRSMSAILVCSAVLALAGAGQAAVVGTATLKVNPPSVPFAAPDAALGSPWVSYVLNLQTTAGELIGGIEVDIQGTLHQRWMYDSETEIFNPTPNSSNQTNGDSHLRSTSGLFFVQATEDNSGIGSPLPDTATVNYGIGSYLRGAWGLTDPLASTDFAYLVVPSNRLHELDIEINLANPNGDIIGQLSERDFFPNVPEPTSCWLLCAGLLAYAAASRRTRDRI